MKEWMKKLNGWKHGFVGGSIFALLFWWFNEASLDPGANCAWLASPGTDAMAFLGAGLCVWRGSEHDDFLVSAFGACVIVIHICQVVVAKSIF